MKHFFLFKTFLSVLLIAALNFAASAQVSLFAVDDGTALKATPDLTVMPKHASNIFVYKVDATDEAISFVKFNLAPFKGKILKAAAFSTISDMNDGKTMTVKLTKSGSADFTRSTLKWSNKPSTSDELATVVYDQDAVRKFFTPSATKLVDYINEALLTGKDEIAFGLVYKAGDGADFKWAGGVKDGSFGPQLDLTFDDGLSWYSTDDGVAIEANPDTTANFLGGTNIFIYQKTVTDRAYAYIKFSLPGLAYKTVSTADISTQSSMNTGKTMTVALRSVASTTFTRSTLKWKNKPGMGSDDLGTAFLEASAARKSFVPVGTKLVDYINSVLATGKEEVAFAIIYKEGDGADFKWMGGKGDGAYGPKLKVTEGQALAGYATGDGTAIQADPTAVASSLGNTNIWVKKTDLGEVMSFVKFDISKFAGRKVISAKFSTRGTMATGKTMTIALHISNSSAFARETLNWSNKPTTGNELATVVMDASSTRKYYLPNTTKLVDYVNTRLQEGAVEIAFAMKYKIGDGADLNWIGGKGDGVFGPLLELELGYDYNSLGIADGVGFKLLPDNTANDKHKSNLFISKTATDEATSYIKFNISALAGKKITSATFSTRAALNTEGKSMTVSLMESTSANFLRSTLTWNNKPATGKELATGLVVKSANRQNYTPVGTAFIDYVNAKLAQMQPEVAFALKYKSGDGDDFSWMGGVGDGSYGPFLELKVEEPVSIDTTTVLEDAYVLQLKPDSVGNGVADMQIGKNGTSDKETYLKFSIDKKRYPVGKVTLLLKGAIKDSNPDALTKFTIQVLGVDNTWKEDALKWSNKPAANSAVLGEFDITSSGFPLVFSDKLTHYVNAALKAGNTQVSFVIKGKSNTGENRAWVSSKEWVPAKIVFDYTVAPPVQEMISIADSYVSQVTEDQNKNFGKEADMNLINDDDNQKSKWNYLRYDISGAYKEPASAILRIYGAIHASSTAINFAYQVFTSDDITWDEDLITWANKPSVNNVVMLQGNLDKKGGWFELGSPAFNDYIKQAVKDGKKFVTLAIKGVDKTPENRAWFSGREWNASIIKMNYDPQVETPFFNPVAGNYIAAVETEIRCNTPNATIYYTIDGSVPTDQSTVYSAKIKLTTTTTLKAIAYSGTLKPSFIAEAKYNLKPVGIPELFPSPLVSYTDDNPPLVTITVVPANAIIYYSDDNGDPLTPYPAGGIQLTKTTTLKVQAYSADGSFSSDVVVANYVVEKTVAGIGEGPGGVGFPDNSISGQPENTLWLMADKLENMNNGDVVSTWKDNSGNGNDATNIWAGKKPVNALGNAIYHNTIQDGPIYVNNGLNGMPALNFGPIDGRELKLGALTIPDVNSKVEQDFDGMAGLSIWLVLKRNELSGWQAVLEKRDFSGSDNAFKNAWIMEFNGSGGATGDEDKPMLTINKEYFLNSTRASSKIMNTTDTYIIGADHRGFGQSTIWVNGALDATKSYNKPINNVEAPIVIGNAGKVNMAEVIFFKKELNAPQKIIVQNYLAAKYGTTLKTVSADGTVLNNNANIYTNTVYKNEVIGVGSDLFGTKVEKHLTSSGGGLQLEAVGSTLDAGEYVFAGHNGIAQAQDVTNKTWARRWFVQVSSSANVDVKIGFNFDKAGFPVPASTTGYGLYYSADGAVFTKLTANPSLSGGVMSFTVPQVVNGYYVLSVGIVTGLSSDYENEHSLKVYPNPAEDYTTLMVNSHFNGKINIELYNSVGGLVKTINSEKMAGSHSEVISTVGLVPGIYLLKVQQGSTHDIIRLLKK